MPSITIHPIASFGSLKASTRPKTHTNKTVDTVNFNKKKGGNNSTLLLDFDEVIYNDRLALNMIKRRVVSFIHERNFTETLADADSINSYLYKKYGHTVVGLNAHFNVKISMEEFNDYLYNEELFDAIHCMNASNTNNQVQYRGLCAKNVVEFARRNGWGAFVFTNAPKRWVKFALGELSIYDTFRDWEIISAEEYGMIKPDVRLYDEVNKDLGFDQHIVFVDDSPINIRNAPLNWTNVLLENSPNEHNNKDLVKIDNLLQLVYDGTIN